MATFLSRFGAGEHQEVWAGLVALGHGVRDPSVLPDALAVAHETMARVSANVDTLVERLSENGYWFAVGDVPRVRPGPETQSELEEAEEKAGPLPLSLRACLLEVGWVDLSGQHPEWPPMYADTERGRTDYSHSYVYADPLVLAPASHLLYNIREWQEDPDLMAENTVTFELAPDEVHKANFSGGSPHGILLPDEGADPPLIGVDRRQGIRLVEFLRTSLSWGGFPGFEFESSAPASLSKLRTGLLPI